MPKIMRKGRWLLALAAVAVVAAVAFEPEIKEVVPGETVVVEKEVTRKYKYPAKPSFRKWLRRLT